MEEGRKEGEEGGEERNRSLEGKRRKVRSADRGYKGEGRKRRGEEADEDYKVRERREGRRKIAGYGGNIGWAKEGKGGGERKEGKRG